MSKKIIRKNHKSKIIHGQKGKGDDILLLYEVTEIVGTVLLQTTIKGGCV